MLLKRLSLVVGREKRGLIIDADGDTSATVCWRPRRDVDLDLVR